MDHSSINYEESTPSKARRQQQHQRSTSLSNIMYGGYANSSPSLLNLPELNAASDQSTIRSDKVSTRSSNNSRKTMTHSSRSRTDSTTRTLWIGNNASGMMKDDSYHSAGGGLMGRWTPTATAITTTATRKKQPIMIGVGIGMILIFWFCNVSVAFTTRQVIDPSSMVTHNHDNNAVNTQGLVTPPGATASALMIRGAGSSMSISSQSIPLPLPKQMVSVVLMNFSRPRMIRESSMMRVLLNHPNVDEVLLLHANPKAAFEFVHPKVVNIDAVEHNDEMGLSLRFYFCQLAKHPWVIHLDDDMEFTTEALNELLIEYSRNPHRIVGRFGRDMTPGNSFAGYNSKDRHKSTEVILTKLMVMERETCSAFFHYASLVWDFILTGDEGPLWNGEDIFMSLVANHVYRHKGHANSEEIAAEQEEFNNYAMDWLNVWQADDSLKDYTNGKNDISGGLSGYRFWDWRWWQSLLRRNRHYSYRGRLWQLARDRLASLEEEL